MRVVEGRAGQALGAVIAAIALLVYAFAPLLHGLVHPDHEIKAVMDAGSGGGPRHHSPAHHQDEDCALFKLYAGHGAHALAVPSVASLPAPFIVAQTSVSRLDPLPAGAPRGFALGRGPPHRA